MGEEQDFILSKLSASLPWRGQGTSSSVGGQNLDGRESIDLKEAILPAHHVAVERCDGLDDGDSGRQISALCCDFRSICGQICDDQIAARNLIDRFNPIPPERRALTRIEEQDRWQNPRRRDRN
jgi:hypothetical protein